VADVKRSQQFYQGLFNATILNDFAEVTDLRIGDSFIGLIRTGVTGRIDHFCVGVENFDVDRLLEQFQRQYPENKPAIQVNPRGEKRLFLTDPDGIRVQLSPVKWQGRNSR
jgi:catechol 2,3-dioxygenase-like lactoylglutathione lyase family enzyme